MKIILRLLMLVVFLIGWIAALNFIMDLLGLGQTLKLLLCTEGHRPNPSDSECIPSSSYFFAWVLDSIRLLINPIFAVLTALYCILIYKFVVCKIIK